MKFTASKRRARLLDPEAKVTTEHIDSDHPEWGVRFVIIGTNARRITSASTCAAAWKHASRRLDDELAERQRCEP